MSIATKALRTDSVAVTEGLVRLRVGLPWYRALPWAGVERISLELDGVDLGPARSIDGSSPEELDSREDYWSIQRWADVEFDRADGLEPGASVSARVRVHLRVPGPLQPDGSPMPFVFDETRLVVLRDGEDALVP